VVWSRFGSGCFGAAVEAIAGSVLGACAAVLSAGFADGGVAFLVGWAAGAEPLG
jgi:hypothetical protein